MVNSNKLRLRRRLAIVLGLFLVSALSACNSGDDDTAPVETTGTPASGSSNSVVLYDYWTNGSQLRSLPRDDFASLPRDLGGYSRDSHFWLYTQNTGSGASVSLDSRNSVLLYVANNRFYRLATAGVTPPLPVQVSSESSADLICSVRRPLRYIPNIDAATLRYRLPGKDQMCFSDDDTFREIGLGMTSSEAPLPIGVDRAHAYEIYSSAGQLSGYLVTEKAGKIYWYDSSFANRRQIIAKENTAIDWSHYFNLLDSSPDGRYRLLALDFNGIYVFDTTTQNMTMMLEFAPYASLGSYAGYHYFYKQATAPGWPGWEPHKPGLHPRGNKSVMRVPMDGMTPFQTVMTDIDVAVGVTDNYLVYQQEPEGGDVEIYSLDLRNPALPAKLIKTLASVEKVSTAAGRVYYTAFNRSDPSLHNRYGEMVWSTKAGSMKADGSDEVVFDGSVWVGTDHRDGAHPAFPALLSDHVYLAQAVSLSTWGAWSGGNLSWVDINTGRIGGAIGVMPNDVYNYRFAGLDAGNTVLGNGYSLNGNTTYYLRANRALGKVVLLDHQQKDLFVNWKSDHAFFPE